MRRTLIMSNLLGPALALSFLLGCNTSGQDAPAPPPGAGDAALKLVKTIPLPGVQGRFDHFAADVKGHRLFVAALGNNTLEVIDTEAGTRAGTVTGLKKPTGVAFVPDSGQVAVAGGDDGT